MLLLSAVITLLLATAGPLLLLEAADVEFFHCAGGIGSVQCKTPISGDELAQAYGLTYAQLFTCVSPTYATRRSAGNFRCPNNGTDGAQNCLMPCSVEASGRYEVLSSLGSDSSLLQQICTCQPPIDSSTPDVHMPTQTSLDSWCYSPESSNCSWFSDCFTKWLPVCKNPTGYQLVNLGKTLCQVSEALPNVAWLTNTADCLETNLVVTLRDFFQPQSCEIANPLMTTILDAKCFSLDTPCDSLPNSADFELIINATLSNWTPQSTSFMRRIFNIGTRCFGSSLLSNSALTSIRITIEGDAIPPTDPTASEDFASLLADELASMIHWTSLGVTWLALPVNDKEVTNSGSRVIIPINLLVVFPSTPDFGSTNLTILSPLNYTILDCSLGDKPCQVEIVPSSVATLAPLFSTSITAVSENANTESKHTESTLAVTTTSLPQRTVPVPSYLTDWNQYLPTVIASGAFQVQAILDIFGQPTLIFANGDVVGLRPNNYLRIAWRAKLQPPETVLKAAKQFDIYYAVYDDLADLIYISLNELDYIGVFWARRTDFNLPQVGKQTNGAEMNFLISNNTNAKGNDRRVAGLAFDSKSRLLFTCDYENEEINLWLVQSKPDYTLYTPNTTYFATISRQNFPLALSPSTFHPSYCAFRQGQDYMMLAVSDPFNNVTYLFQGNFSENWSMTNIIAVLNVTRPRGPLSTRRPQDLTFDKNGNLYVTDFNNFRIQAFQFETKNKSTTVYPVWSSYSLTQKPIRIGTFTSPQTRNVSAIIQYYGNDLVFIGDPTA